MLSAGERALADAMAQDMAKPRVEGWLTDVAAVRQDVRRAAKAVAQWAAPRPVRAPLTLQPARAYIQPEPKGTVLVLGPWNYPVRCVALPLAAALAAGNTVAVKPSELAPATSAVLARLTREHLGSSAVAVVEGGPDVAEELLARRWDHIFFTGGATVGRLVMKAASAHLTPVTLELGGKNPAIVTERADLGAAARRIAWGRFLNAGQTCVAPDFVLVDERVEPALAQALSQQLERFFGPDPRTSPSYGRVVNQVHFERLSTLLTRTRGDVAVGGQGSEAERYLAPTVVRHVGWDDPLMQEEIFGPVLPLVTYRVLADALAELRQREKPLALYVYTRDPAQADLVVEGSSSGSVCVNHNAVQLAVPGLPFGGVGASGMGAYHGRAGFDTFSHLKAVLRKPPRAELALMYPPYTRLKEWALGKALK